MPEEKVSTEPMGTCPFETRPHPYSRCSVKGIWEPLPPAADAGPRLSGKINQTWVADLIEKWEEYYTAFTSPHYAVHELPDAIKGLRQCIDELKEAAPHQLSEWTVCPVCKTGHAAAPPVPQEAAPRCKKDQELVDVGFAENPEEVEATAPDWVMRVAIEFWPRYWNKIPGGFTGTERAAQQFAAALIRQAGSESRKPDGWAHQYHNCIRFNQGETVNGEQPFHAVPYWLETNGEAGSERERELENGLLEEHLIEASRLLGGESK